MKNYTLLQLVLILMSLVICFALGLDMYVPLLPQITEAFGTTPALAQLTMSLFLFTVAIGQLLLGPVSDHFGRKKVLIISACLFAIGSFSCVFSSHIWGLITMRVFSGVGACGLMVTSFAMVRDLVSEEESAKVFSFLNGATGISPTIAPIIGSYLCYFCGWQSVFIFLAIVGLVALFISSYFVQETVETTKKVPLDRQVFGRYRNIFSQRQFLTYASIAGFAQTVIFGFSSISPFIIIEHLKVPEEEFGYYFAAFGLVLCLGGFASGKLIEKIGTHQTFKLGVALMFAGGVSMAVWSLVTPLTLFGFLAPMIIACTGAILLAGGSISSALEPFPEMAGTASAAFGSLRFGLCSCIGASLMLFPVNTALPYATCILLMAALSALLYSLRPDSVRDISPITLN